MKKPTEEWIGIFFFVKEGGVFDRLPTLYFNSKDNVLQYLLCQDPTDSANCKGFYSQSYALNVKYDVEFTHQLEGRVYYMSAYINGQRKMHQSTFSNPGIFENVEVYIGSWFPHDQDAGWCLAVSNLMYANTD